MMRNALLFLIFNLTILTCNDSDKSLTIEGDLSFKLIELGSFYALADGLEEKVFDLIDSLNGLPEMTLSENEKEFMGLVNFLEQHDLLFLPSFNLKTDKGDYRVYIDSLEYDRIGQYKREHLVQENMKVRLKLKGQLLATNEETFSPIFRCSEISSIEKVPGKTYWRK